MPKAVGVEPQSADQSAEPLSGLGEPFVPIGDHNSAHYAETDRFGSQFERVALTAAKITRLGKLVHTLPIRHPIEKQPPSPADSARGTTRSPDARRCIKASIRAVRCTPVLENDAGTIRQNCYGKMAVIDHGNDLSTRYGHLHRLSVSAGDTVKAGDKIGAIGSTGPHLHYEVRRDGKDRFYVPRGDAPGCIDIWDLERGMVQNRSAQGAEPQERPIPSRVCNAKVNGFGHIRSRHGGFHL